MGEVFAGRYELVDPIGRGGVGAVWRVWDHRRRRYAAAKVLQQRDAHSLLRFVREQALRIDHPHVLAPTSWAADDDQVLFTMDLVTGGSLVHLVGDYGPLPPAFVCTLLDQLLSGLAAVHAEGVVHRDVKPANILLEATGTGRPRLRLSDFGIAMRLGEPRLTETNLVVGTPGYLAPEQLLGAEPDFPADLFAAGLVALYLLEGAKPDAKALVQYFADHGTPGAPKNVPEPLWQVVAALLQPDPQARFRTATGARKALAAAAELLPEPGPDDELIEIFDQVGPLPAGFGPEGPLRSTPDDTTVSPRTGRRMGYGGPTPAHTGHVPPLTGHVPPHTDHVPPYSGSDQVTGSASDPRGLVAGPAPDPRGHATGPPHTPAAPPFRTWDDGTGSLPGSGTGYGSGSGAHDATTGTAFGTPQPPAASPYGTPPAPPFGDRDGTGGSAPARRADTAVPLTPGQGGLPQPPSVPDTPTRPLPTVRYRPDTATASYTVGAPRDVHSPGDSPRRRPGPPARVAVPLLLLALVCYAVGFWALARS
ncbi:protein kinase domain-containing protein [Streptomyces sp. NPDC003395]